MLTRQNLRHALFLLAIALPSALRVALSDALRVARFGALRVALSGAPRVAIAVALLVAFLAACGGPMRALDGLVVLPKIRDPKAAILLAKSTEDAALASEIAWLEGNDRALARDRLDAGLVNRPLDRDLLLRRALLNLEELCDRSALEDLAQLIETAPDSAEAELALVLVHEELSRFLTWRDRVRASLMAANFLDRPCAPSRVTLTTAILARLDALDRAKEDFATHLARGGWVREFSVTGPMAPPLFALLRTGEDLAKTGSRSGLTKLAGLDPPTRKVRASALGVPVTTGERSGVYVLETLVELRPIAGRKTVVLEAHMPTRGQVYLDGQLVVRRELPPGRGRKREEMFLEVEPGWHRLSILLIASSETTVSLSLLGLDGDTVITRVDASRQDEAPWGLPTITTPKEVFLVRGRSRQAIDPLLDAPERSHFGRVLGARIAASAWNGDLEQARRLMQSIQEGKKTSAFVLVSEARLIERLGFPESLALARLRDALSLDPTYPFALVTQANALIDDAPDAALELSARALTASDSSAAHEVRFRVLRQRGWQAEAHAEIDAALRANPSAALVADAADFYRSLDRILDAKRMDEAALALTEPSPGRRLAEEAVRRGDIESATRLLREVAHTHDVPADALADVAELELARRDPRRAEEAANSALAFDPLHRKALGLLASSRIVRGDKEGALGVLGQLRTMGQSSVKMEALFAKLEGRVLGLPAVGTALGTALEFDPWPHIRAPAGGTPPRGLDPLDRWSRHKSVDILDRVVDWVHPSGHALSMRHQITRLQTKEAADQVGEIALPGDALPLHIRTLKSDGRTIDVDRHPGKSDLSFSALAPGDAVERQFVTLDEPSSTFGGYLRRFSFRSTSPLIRSEFVVVVPKGLRVWHQSYNGAPAPRVLEDSEDSTYIWRAEDVPAIEPEPHSAPVEEFLPFVVVAVGLSDAQALEANVLRAATRDPPTWCVRAAARAAVGAETPAESKARALFRFVVQEIGDGRGGNSDVILATKRGRRTGLYMDMLRAEGIETSLLLVRPSSLSTVTPPYPDPGEFSLPVVAIDLSSQGRKPGGQPTRVYAGLEGDRPWYGAPPPDLRDATYIEATNAPRRDQVRRFDASEVASWRLESAVDLSVDAAGTAAGTVTVVLPGAYGSEIRKFLERARRDEIDRFVQGWAASVFPGARSSSWSTLNREDILLPLTLTAHVEVEHFMLAEGGHLVAEQFFDAPIAASSLGLPLLGAYLQTSERRTPLLIEEVLEVATAVLRLPRTTRPPVESPKTFDIENDYGQFSQDFTWNDEEKVATFERKYSIVRKRIPVSQSTQFRTSAQELLQNMRNRLILRIDAPSREAGGPGTEPHASRG